MTTDRRRVTVWLGSVVAVFAAVLVPLCGSSCAGASSIRHGDTLDVSQYPQDIQDSYKVFEVRCRRCHTLARPLNAHIDDAQHWVRYVDRMRHNPSSGINAKNGEIILKFLIYYMHARERESREAEAQGEQADAAPDAGAAPKTGGDSQPAPDKAPTPPPPSAAGPSDSGQSALPAQQSADTLAVPPKNVSEPASAEMNP